MADSKGTFSLYVWPESFEYGGPAQFSLAVSETADTQEVKLLAEGRDIRAALVELRYDAASVYPVGSRSAGALAAEGAEELSLSVSNVPGVVYFGAVMPGLDEAQGASGELELATFTFLSGAAAEHKAVRTTPKLPASSIPDLAVDTETGEVTFSYYNNGDYDQNSEVNISDLTRIGIEFGESVVPDTFDPALALSVVDGDSNGEINAADITPIGLNFGNKLDGWELYAGSAADYPMDATGDNGSAVSLGTIPLASNSGDPGIDRLSYAVNVPGAVGATGEVAWLRPLGSDGEGIASAAFTLSTAGDTTPPEWTNGEPGTGVQGVIPGDGEVTVTWGEALDSESSPVTYVVYYNEGSSVDYETATTIEIVASDPPDPFVDQLTTITGLTNDSDYAFAVRARDAADPPNMEANEELLTATPRATVEMPSMITESMTFDGPVVLSDGNTSEVVCTEDVVLTFLGSLTIEEGGVLTGGDGNCDLCLIVNGDLVLNGEIDFNINDVVDVDGNVKSLKLVPMANFETGDNSLITTEGNLYIVDDEDDLIAPEEAADDVDNGQFDEFDFTLMPLPESESAGKSASSSKTTSVTQYYGPWWTWRPRGNWGKIPVPPGNVNRIILRIFQRRGRTVAQNFSLEGPDGAPGTDDLAANCTAQGGDGEDNKWRLRWHASRSLTFDNVTLKFGDGGRGGDASTPGDCCPASATGGNGADSSNRFRITAGNLISINNAFNLNPGNGGRGGHAEATARDGATDCPGEDGCDATAVGGAGGNVPRWGVRVRGNVFGAASINLGQAEGGRGGDADATSGDGGDGDPCCDAGHGGIADAIAGNGGDAHFTDGGSAAMGGGAKAGDGGDAISFAGNGGDGGDCYKAQAGNGGDGGDAFAVGGDPGTTTGDAPQVPGNEGGASSFAGDGGDGGDGFPVGAGGAAGIALAAGTPSVESDGLPGADGVEWPTGGFVVWCIALDDFLPGGLPGPIPPSHSGTCTLVNMDTLEPVGEAPFQFFGLEDAIFGGVTPPPDERTYIQFFNPPESLEPIGLRIDLRNLELTGPVGPLMGARVPVNLAEHIVPATQPLGELSFLSPPDPPLGSVELPLVPLGEGPLEVELVLDPPAEEAVCQLTVFPNSAVEIIDYIYIVDP